HSCATARPPSRSDSNSFSTERSCEGTMSNVPADLRYLKSHEWARLEDDGTITIGISDHAQQALGDLVFVEAPEAGRRVAAGEAVAVVESVKAAPPVYSPRR